MTDEIAEWAAAQRRVTELMAGIDEARGDVTPYLDAFATLGPLPDADLTE